MLGPMGDVKVTHCASLVMQVVEFMDESVCLKETKNGCNNVYVAFSSFEDRCRAHELKENEF